VVETCEGPQETKIVMALLRLRDDVTGRVQHLDQDWSTLIADSRARAEQMVNEFFKDRLFKIPEVREFMDSLEERA
jgi:hypothetical protein